MAQNYTDNTASAVKATVVLIDSLAKQVFSRMVQISHSPHA